MMWNEFTLGFLLALICASCWASLDVIRKKLGTEMQATAAVAGLMLLQFAYINPLLIAGSALNPGDGLIATTLLAGYPKLSAAYFPPALASVVLNLAANSLFLRAVQISPLSLTTPYLAFTPVFTAFTAMFFLNQIPSTPGWFGIGIVCLGAFFMNPGAKDDGILAPLKALWTERGSLYMLIVAMIWSVTPLLDKQAAEATNPFWHTMFIASGVGLLLVLYHRISQGSLKPLLQQFRAAPLWLALGSFFAVGAMGLQLTSYAFIDIAYVETIKRAIGVIAAIAAGYFFFGEREIRRRLIGAAVMCVGVALIMMAP